uniref:28S ribosomal protein S34, mitochondrial n=1 Tax=Strongyloides stercoralis TaxID=6248 RepID=A0A913HLL1_STRER
MASGKPIRFIGNYDYASEGKFLFEILCQLRNMGCGRIVTKTEWCRKWPNEPSYVRIVRARPEMDPWQQKGSVFGEWVFRGKNLGIYEFSKDLNRSDWKLVSKLDEEKLIKNSNEMQNIVFPKTMPLPPLQLHLTKKFAEKAGRKFDEKDSRVPLNLCIDSQFKMIEEFFVQSDTKVGKNIYEECDKESILKLYGDMLPTKVEAWNIGGASIKPRFEN